MTKITRDTFISEEHVKTALMRETMFIYAEDGDGVVEVPIPESVRCADTLPEGTRVDFAFDPETAVVSLARQGITTIEQLSERVVEGLKAIINGPDNLRIVPTRVYEEKRELTRFGLGLTSR